MLDGNFQILHKNLMYRKRVLLQINALNKNGDKLCDMRRNGKTDITSLNSWSRDHFNQNSD